ncbi:amino acid ABC transporter permease [Streptomyces sp. 1331.2]|uniref:amino acid ABC transporter permease n=1 Tax=Streptomyces sp. 1331.2 TaxID=1938835 RepID=UPI000BD31FB3|nr:amino acid ABC transporter permease [Streptomyces sp. 1331.2]SOB82096.1 amino acid ABC transporter membrane protein, PAAT family [Streptomyces sp. 1331.2]
MTVSTHVPSAPARPRPEATAAGAAAVDLDALDGLRTVPARHPWRWAAGAAALVVLAQFAHGLATNPGWDWATFRVYFTAETILRAIGRTLELTAYGTVLGFLLGAGVAAMRLSRSAILRAIAWAYVWVFRSIPLIVQLVFWFNLSYLYKRFGIGIPFGPTFGDVETVGVLSALGAAVLGLGLHQAAFAAEIIRGGIIAVDAGQREAAAALGIPRWRQAWRIVLPQAMRGILPAAANEVISLLKGTSVVYVMAIGELFYQAQVIYGRTGRVVPLLMVATVWYVVLTTVLSIGQYYVERYFARGAQHTPPPTPLQRLRAFARTAAARTTGGQP